ncbi:hypothetical protein [Nocardia sp. NPDC051463]|uniref:hypothetical protein n=1 Tax=Nocardia sp. NPDC051463 TaxID=3154845 RepID=UPI00344F2871
MSETDPPTTALTSVRAARRERIDQSTLRITHLRLDVPVPDAALSFAATAVDDRHCRVARRGAGDSLDYLVPSNGVTGLGISEERGARECVRALAGVVSKLHAVRLPPVGVLPSCPPWLVRLGKHLHGDADGLVARLTSGRLRRHLAAVVRDARTEAATVIHGAPSLGGAHHARGHTTVMVGEDLAQGRPELDWGYLLGEIQELAHLPSDYPVAEFSAALIDEHRSTMREAGLDYDYIQEVAVAKRLLHLVDYEQTCRMFGADVPDIETVSATIADLNDIFK